MKIKITTGLIATNGDGKPSIRPPIPAGWCRPTPPASLENSPEVKPTNGHNSYMIMSDNNSVSTESSQQPREPSPQNGTSMSACSAPTERETDHSASTNGQSSTEDSNPVAPQHGSSPPPSVPASSSSPPSTTSPTPAAVTTSAIHTSTPSPAASAPAATSTAATPTLELTVESVAVAQQNEDSNVDVESADEQLPSLLGGSQQDGTSSSATTNSGCVDSSLGTASHSLGYGSGVADAEMQEKEHSDARYIEKAVVDSFLHQPDSMIDLSEEPVGDTLLPPTSQGETTQSVLKQPEKIMDALSMTIASVAAGEGEPPEYVSKFIPPDPTKNKAVSSGKSKKSRADRPMSASARLPVISSLLAPPTTGASPQNNVLPSIHQLAGGSRGPSPTTALPSVSHFLGPAKPPTPPTGYVTQQQQQHMTSELLTSMGGHHSTDINHQYGATTPGKSNKTNKKPVTPAGLRLSMAASEELPDPLPYPQYSDKVIRAKQLGTVAFDRPTVLRETVQFFLQFKHYWSSHDYDRISNLVIELFPEFKDNSDTPGVPANKRIRTDLSMYARNFRRREVSQKKRDTGAVASVTDHTKTDAITGAVGPTTGVMAGDPSKSFLHPSPPPTGATSQAAVASTVAGANPSDFCNELLTAASIIESQNTTVSAKNGEASGIENHHKGAAAREAHTKQATEHHQQHAGSDYQQGAAQRDGSASQPIHFVYDKDSVTPAATRDANAAWQIYSDQMTQAIASGNSSFDYATQEQAIKKDLGTCARNMRRRLPSAKFNKTGGGGGVVQGGGQKSAATSVASWVGTSGAAALDAASQQLADAGGVQSEYMKAVLAAQNMNISELGMTQRNLGELAVLAGIKQRIEQHPGDVSDLERQYLAQCTSEEQRQALAASGAFAGDSSTAMAALSAFYGQLGVELTTGKRQPGSGSSVTGGGYSLSDVSATSVGGGMGGGGDLLVVPNKRQRRISQAEVEKRLREAELNHVSQQHLQLQQTSLGVVSVSDKHLVKREPSSPSSSSRQHLTVPTPINMSTVSSVSADPHNTTYWDSSATPLMAPPSSTQAHSQVNLSGTNNPHDLPMNLTYHEADKMLETATSSPSTGQPSDSPTMPESLPDTAGLAAQVWYPHNQGVRKENQEVVALPDPLPIPVYSQKMLTARDDGTSMRHRSEIIRETARFFLGLKYWWSSADYTRISELVVQQFPDLKDDSTGDNMNNYRRIQRDLSMCARNLRRSKKPRKMRELSSSDLSNSMDGESNNNDDFDKDDEETGGDKKRSRLKGSLYGGAADKKVKRGNSSGFRSKKLKPQHQIHASNLDVTDPSPAVTSDPSALGMTEDMTAAAALMQHQFIQQQQQQSTVTGAYQSHPSAHLLPTAHMLPSLNTHPALHDQHLQQMNVLQQGDGTNISVEDAHSARRLVKEEPSGHEALDHTHPGDKQAQMSASSTLKVYVDQEHGSDLQERFSTLWRKGKFFDASLGVANKKLHVHKLVLLAMSPYLQETFKNADPRSQLEVNLPSDTTYETAKAFLKYIYEGILEVDTSSVRSLHKIAMMLQMTKLAQYCQNFAQQLQEEAEQLQRLGGDTTLTSDPCRSGGRYLTEEQLQLKAGYMTSTGGDVSSQHAAHFLQHPALVGASSTASQHQQQQEQLIAAAGGSGSDLAAQHLQLQAALARHQAGSPTSAVYAQEASVLAGGVSAADNSFLRLTSPALAAYWQAHTLNELVARGGMTSDPANQTTASELAAIAAAAAATTSTSALSVSSMGEGNSSKGGRQHPSHHHKDTAHQWVQQQHPDAGSMLPETCLPGNS